jgi:Protein of unknown function (DUF4435)
MRRRPVVIANEIRLKRSQFRGSFLVVEGRDDRLLSERFADLSQCKIQVAEGKASVCEVISILDNDGFAGVAGLVDADFDRIQGRQTPSANIIVSDLHDLESMLIRSRALDAVLVEHGSSEKLQLLGRDVRELLILAASPIGCLRLHSERCQLNLRFDGLDYGRCINQRTLEIDSLQLIEAVKNRSQRPELSTQVLLTAIEEIRAENHNPWELCAGPDLIATLSIGLRRAFGTNNSSDVNEDQLRRALRLAYTTEEFKSSSFGQSLSNWESRNSPFVILKPRAL